MSLQDEILHAIPDDNLSNYRITETGKIWSETSKRFLKVKLGNGYHKIYLCAKSYAIHRLVALTFLENPNNHPVVHHKDSNKLNNHFSNLEWVTQATNIAEVTTDTSHPRAVLQYDKDNNLIERYDTVTEAANAVSLTRGAISKACLGKHKSAGGFVWKYENEDFLHVKDINLSDTRFIEGYEHYKIFKNGDIYNQERKSFLKPIKNHSSYCYVSFSKNNKKKNFYVHVLVATCYIEKDDDKKTQVNHKNKIKDDNKVENLEWVTPSENMIHCYKDNTKQ
jgi:hypothetical protein